MVVLSFLFFSRARKNFYCIYGVFPVVHGWNMYCRQHVPAQERHRNCEYSFVWGEQAKLIFNNGGCLVGLMELLHDGNRPEENDTNKC